MVGKIIWMSKLAVDHGKAHATKLEDVNASLQDKE